MHARMFIAFLIVLTSLSCTRRENAEDVGDHFVEAYYVKIDQAQAVEYAAGLARDRLQAELQQVTQLRTGNTLDRARPPVTYSRARTQLEGRQVLLTYDLTITPTHVAPILKKILLITEQVGEQWRVVNFTEMDARP